MNEEALMVFSTGFKDNFKKSDEADLKVVSILLNLPISATINHIYTAVKALNNTNIILSDENVKLKNEVRNLKNAAFAFEKGKVINLVDSAIINGTISANESDYYITLALGNYNDTKRLLDKKTALLQFADITK